MYFVGHISTDGKAADRNRRARERVLREVADEQAAEWQAWARENFAGHYEKHPDGSWVKMRSATPEESARAFEGVGDAWIPGMPQPRRRIIRPARSRSSRRARRAAAAAATSGDGGDGDPPPPRRIRVSPPPHGRCSMTRSPDTSTSAGGPRGHGPPSCGKAGCPMKRAPRLTKRKRRAAVASAAGASKDVVEFRDPVTGEVLVSLQTLPSLVLARQRSLSFGTTCPCLRRCT